ncbi:hypothetical protein Aca07nite_72190 [Actinoplanes capillaceus]|uniref:TniQ domain-containing protein n=1 Tax=Actinoplanes campanulatus TaxID=113559 RepID=A0ABQ3WUM4_9ACTN|nr:TniQ family protein [Actinoplanes capillaceus]GID49944.1 hypothetical protein Aca07nite_72190 [Actinoplanes capillaceus]
MTSLLDPPAPLPAPLPIPVRPRPPESVNSYIRRLARANHLRPSYLRIYLAQPPQHLGSVRAPRLAAATGRSVEALLHTFPDLQATPRQRQVSTPRLTPDAAQELMFEAIRAEARTTFSIRTLMKTFGVPSRTIIKALARVEQPHPTSKNFPILEPFRHHIEPLITNPAITIWAIWTTLIDEHDADVSYGTVRDYVTSRRRRAEWDQQS